MGNSIIDAQLEFKEQSGSDNLPNTKPFSWLERAEQETEKLYKEYQKVLDRQWELYNYYHSLPPTDGFKFHISHERKLTNKFT